MTDAWEGKIRARAKWERTGQVVDDEDVLETLVQSGLESGADREVKGCCRRGCREGENGSGKKKDKQQQQELKGQPFLPLETAER